MTLGEDVAVADVQCKIVKSVLGLPGVRAAQPSVRNKDHRAGQDKKNLLRLVEEQNAQTYTKHGSVIPLNQLTVN